MLDRVRPPRRPRLPLRFLRSEGGAAAVEFGIIAVPFVMLLAGILELGFLFMGSVALDNAVAEASRRIRTGELKNAAGATEGDKEATRLKFRDEICGNTGLMVGDCEANLTVDVRTAAQFQDVNIPGPVKDKTFDAASLEFETGGPSTIVVVTAYYEWPMFMPMVNQGLMRLNGKALLTSVTSFQTEPYNGG